MVDGPIRKGLRLARRHTDRYPVAVSAGNCRPQQRQDRCAASGPMRRQLHIAIGGMQSGPPGRRLRGNFGLFYSFSSSPAATRRTRSELRSMAAWLRP